MAEDRVVRRDVVQIEFEVKDNPLNKLMKSMGEFTKAAKKMSGTDEALKKVKDKASQAATGLEKMAGKASAIKSKLQPTIDKIDSGLKKIGTSAVNAGKKIASGLGKVAVTAVKGLAAGMAAFGAAAGLSVKSFAEYEQLKGGAEKIFDQANVSGILTDASKAYIDLGMSANEYLSVANSVGATFAATMGDQRGYDTMKVGMQAISDYASGTGKDINELMDKYTLITRSASSYQSIADQFSGILPATSKDFLKQAQSAGFLSKKYTDLTKVPIAEYQEAVSKMLEKGTADLGLAGNTAFEATKTLSGSLGMMKAAWSNFLTGMADPDQDFDALVGNLLDSIVAVTKNLVPRLKVLAPRLAAGLLEIGKTIAPLIPPMLRNIMAKVIEYAPVVGAKLNELLLKAKDYVVQNSGAIWESFKTVLAQGIATVFQIFTGEQLDVEGIKQKIQEVTDKAMGFVNGVKQNWPLIKGLIMGVVGAILLLKGAMFICNTIIAANNAVMAAKKAIDIAVAAKAKLAAAAQWLFNTSIMGCPVFWLIAAILALIAIIVLLVKNWDKVKAAGEKCWEAIKTAWGKASAWLDEKVVTPLKNAFQSAWDFVTDLWSGITDFFSGLWDGIKNIVSKITGKASEAKSGAETVKNSGNPRKHANGGLITRPHLGLVGEAGPEMIIPLSANRRNRGMSLWQQAGRMLGAASTAPSVATPTYTPQSTVSNTTNNRSETNTYAPQFTLNLSGNADSTTERKVKQWIKEAMNEMFESMERANPRLQEV